MERPRLSFWDMFNMSFRFLGIQFGWGLQLAKMSAVYGAVGRPPRAFVADKLTPSQRTAGFVMQSFFTGERDVPGVAVIEADEKELFTVPESAQPVPSTGLMDK